MEAARIEHIDTPEGRILWREMLGVLPGLRAVLNFVTSRQATSPSGRLLWYQKELFERWFFRIPSPHTGCMIHSGDSWTGRHQTTFFRFPEASDIALASYSGGEGFPLGALFLAKQSLATVSGVAFGSRTLSLLIEDAASAFQAFSTPVWKEMPALSSATAIAGFPQSDDAKTQLLAQEVAALKVWRAPVALSFQHVPGDRPCLSDNRAGHVSFCL
ncbi:hypothetical protein AA0242T_0912 [Acetobacter aceti NRIC 0242]|uniref:Uncharacterized protein n=1 Tax=Acetobacter aceti NBRC 14818 TaxID=887700 RepID=A0AB33IEX4_ACEAC|nr:hypothetical protein [Acetobacter aceti]TCS34978.1 hypothetical protein EDC15_102189 [Acetobacter aceti NBRC 14818]BCK74442.1 hypothetical protein EMQ_0048 [Acetobacter aceti NBRC 14818]GAN55951.1 hypothetical protein Abac_002_100 [Acetobacter aceti NBRC 14818]GBO80210.1 hypothetical protein AA0242T_0912 [Acetobacter aceti NRIC 0242]